jgi:Tfp pilus assembly protein PilO
MANGGCKMNKLDMHYAYWLLSRLIKALGVWGVLGLALFLVSCVFYFTKVASTTQQLQQAQFELERAVVAQEDSPKVEMQQVVPAQTKAEDLAKFYDIFPAGASLPEWLRLIDETALKQKLILKRGDYKLTQSQQGQLQRYEIVLPVAGKYVQIRQFIAEVLLKSPALALGDIKIRRENTMSPNVEARLVFVLFLQGNSWLK